MNVIRHREFGTMKQERAIALAQLLNRQEQTDVYSPKHRFGDRWIIIETVDCCDIRCVDAIGSECNCKCLGVNHGKEVA